MVKVERKAPGGKKEVTLPHPVDIYTKNMGGVDLADQHHSYYPVGRPSVRWWRYICWWLLQTAMVNSFILWKNSQPAPEKKKKGPKHISFRLEVLRALCKGKVSVRQRSAPEAPSQWRHQFQAPYPCGGALSREQEKLCCVPRIEEAHNKGVWGKKCLGMSRVLTTSVQRRVLCCVSSASCTASS